MEGVSFQASLDRRLIDRMRGSAEVQRFVYQQWRHLNDRMGRYIADNLSAEVFQLIRIHRNEHWNNNPHGDGLLTITLEVGQVTERPFVTVGTIGNDPAYRPLEIRPETTYAEIEAQRTQPVAASMFRTWNEYVEAVLETERRAFPDTPPAAGSGVPGGPDEAMWQYIGSNTPPAPKTDPVPHKRHILIDKKNPTPENTP